MNTLKSDSIVWLSPALSYPFAHHHHTFYITLLTTHYYFIGFLLSMLSCCHSRRCIVSCEIRHCHRAPIRRSAAGGHIHYMEPIDTKHRKVGWIENIPYTAGSGKMPHLHTHTHTHTYTYTYNTAAYIYVSRMNIYMYIYIYMYILNGVMLSRNK